MKSLVLGFFLGIAGMLFSAELLDAENILHQFKEKFGVVKTIRCDFIQTREMPAMEMKLEFTGRMAYDAHARRFLWRVQTPMPCAFRMQNDEFAQWDGETGKILTIPVTKLPWISLLQERLDQWLAGDFHSLCKEAEVTVLDANRICFKPSGGMLGVFAKDIEIECAKDFKSVTRIRIEEQTGDILTILFHNAILNQPIPAEEWRL